MIWTSRITRIETLKTAYGGSDRGMARLMEHTRLTCLVVDCMGLFTLRQ
jgi:hypothetical protein